MTGDAHWSTGAVLLAGLLGVVTMLALAWWRYRHLAASARSLVCPTTHRRVDCVVVQDRRNGRFTGVRDCSLFAERGARCTRACVARLNGERRRG